MIPVSLISNVTLMKPGASCLTMCRELHSNQPMKLCHFLQFMHMLHCFFRMRYKYVFVGNGPTSMYRISIITGKDLVHQDSFDIVMETPI